MVQATGRREVRLASVALGRPRHSCAQSRHRKERYDVLLPSIREGLAETSLETPTKEPAQ